MKRGAVVAALVATAVLLLLFLNGDGPSPGPPAPDPDSPVPATGPGPAPEPAAEISGNTPASRQAVKERLRALETGLPEAYRVLRKSNPRPELSSREVRKLAARLKKDLRG